MAPRWEYIFAVSEALKQNRINNFNPHYKGVRQGKKKNMRGLDTEKRKYLRALASEGKLED